MKRLAKVLALILLAAVVGCGCLLWTFLPDRRIAGNWRDPQITIWDAKMHRLEGGGGLLVSYFYNISQDADLLHPRGSAWGREITERVHQIARGYETLVLDPSGQTRAVLPIKNNATDFCYVDGQLYLRTTWSHYSEDGLYRVDPESGTAVEMSPTEKSSEHWIFRPLEAMESSELTDRHPAITERLRKQARFNSLREALILAPQNLSPFYQIIL